MTGKQEEREKDEAERTTGARGAGQSGGGPQGDAGQGRKREGGFGGVLGHGGQSRMAYHGTGQLGDEKVGGNENAPARGDDDGD